MANKHLALLVSFSVENGFKTALLVAAKRYAQLYEDINPNNISHIDKATLWTK
jgi:hypothetical protein